MTSSNTMGKIHNIHKILPITKINIDIKDVENELKELYALRDQHPIWENPLLIACQMGQLSIDDFWFLFAQYYLYSRSFTKLLAACMVHCDNDYYRSCLSANLWEEGGGQAIENRHSEIFRQFLIKHLNIQLDAIEFEPYTKYFFNQYLDLCLNTNSISSAAALSFGTEGIVSRLYTIFIQGLKIAGFDDNALTFFQLHIECDDDHAETLEEMTLSYCNETEWRQSCEQGLIRALDLRNDFFNNIYKTLQIYKLAALTKRINHSLDSSTDVHDLNMHSTIYQIDNPLYYNKDITKNINFMVHRIPFKTDVLDPRLVIIPQGYCNEFHQHAHETIFMILEGTGEVSLDGQKVDIKSGDLIFVPRWKLHQTVNTGTTELKFFAVTDYGLTKIFPENSETGYRKKPHNVSANFIDCTV